jgi:regulator of cell morphogenesis and NO signaling
VTHTMNFDAKVGSLAAEHPEYIPVFERFGIDYCCHGSRSLDEACAAAGADAGIVRDALTSMPPTTHPEDSVDWRRASMTELADHIEQTHHVFVGQLFERIGAVLPRVVESHASGHPWLVPLAAVIGELREDMKDHMVREERVLFPWLRRLERPSELDTGPPWSVKRPIDCMVHDHVEVARALARIRELTSGYTVPADACGSLAIVLDLLHRLEADTCSHIHKENNILFPAGVLAEKARQERPRTTMGLCGGQAAEEAGGACGGV